MRAAGWLPAHLGASSQQPAPAGRAHEVAILRHRVEGPPHLGRHAARRHHRLAGRALSLAADAQRRVRGGRARLGLRSASHPGGPARGGGARARSARVRGGERHDAAQARGRRALRDRGTVRQHARRTGRADRGLLDGRGSRGRSPGGAARRPRRRWHRGRFPELRSRTHGSSRAAGAGRPTSRAPISSSTRPPSGTKSSSSSVRGRRSSTSRIRRPRRP